MIRVLVGLCLLATALSLRLGGGGMRGMTSLRMSANTKQGETPKTAPIPSFTTLSNQCKIKVIGVGGGGGNAVNRMVAESDALGVEMWTINTDSQAIVRSKVKNTLNIGKTTSRGLGAGGVPAVGQAAAEESRDEIIKIVSGADLVFVTAGEFKSFGGVIFIEEAITLYCWCLMLCGVVDWTVLVHNL